MYLVKIVYVEDWLSYSVTVFSWFLNLNVWRRNLNYHLFSDLSFCTFLNLVIAGNSCTSNSFLEIFSDSLDYLLLASDKLLLLGDFNCHMDNPTDKYVEMFLKKDPEYGQSKSTCYIRIW